MNQKYGQTATSSVEKDFYKLLNNSNFGIDCTNNIDNCTLEPIYDDFSEISYIKNYTTIFNDDSLRDLFLPPLSKQERTQTYDTLNKEDPTYKARKKYFERKKEEDIDPVNTFEKNKKVKKGKFQSIKNTIFRLSGPKKNENDH